MGNFDKLGLKKEIINALTRLKFKEALEVQDKIIPLAIQSKNIVFTSRTGSGKTLAYLLGYLGKINKKIGVQMVVLVPTRELCIQVGKEMKKVCDFLNINVGMLYGGREIAGDKKTTSKKNQIIVGTPGRFIQHINNKTVKVGEVKYLVYDESDQMLDDGFYDECSYMIKRVSKNVQIILSSATLTSKVKDFINNEIRNFELLNIGSQIPKNIVQEKIYCKISEKDSLLLKFFTEKKFKRVLIFCNTKARTYSISEYLTQNKFKAREINGGLKQDERDNNLNLFKQGKVNILVATDVAARGLHIENVDMIINYDIPRRHEFYVHRIGRTGRRDKEGYSLSIICPEDEERFKNLEFLYDLKTNLIDKK
jgi:ATP-dependent RNA helicase DeaD